MIISYKPIFVLLVEFVLILSGQYRIFVNVARYTANRDQTSDAVRR